MGELTRVFIGVDVDLAVCEKLVLVQEDLTPLVRERNAKVRWVAAQNLHGTLKFVGEIERSFVPRVCDVLRRVAAEHKPFTFTMSGIGVFPDAQRPRIIFGRVVSGDSELAELARDLDTELGELGMPRERRDYKPHITLGRIKTPSKRLDFGDVTEALAELPLGSTKVRDLVLFESQLTPRGAQYTVVMRAHLKGVSAERGDAPEIPLITGQKRDHRRPFTTALQALTPE